MSDDPKKVVDLATVKRSKPSRNFDPVASMSVDADGGVLVVTTEAGRVFNVTTDERQALENGEAEAILNRVGKILGEAPEAS